MSSLSIADFAPVSGNRPVKQSWAGKPFSALDADDLLSIRTYIVSEASSLGHNHGRRKCADANATNPFHPEFFLGKPHRFWNEVYQQSAEAGALANGSSIFTQVLFERPLDTIRSSELLITLSTIEALKNLHADYCSSMETLCLEPAAELITEWEAALIWYDLKESDFSLLLDYRGSSANEEKVISNRPWKHDHSPSII